ncbi:hypothetical protein FSP39_014249 [Pinctada imbricata]|uniref:Rho GTPase-activating protein 20 n=1 Tax=Pinctada imbricata TaxID=66713 RepID=A0AA88Y4U6_PINIB|nr:hypothetical protein FSP39_014249 [Pinctada imbricata]
MNNFHRRSSWGRRKSREGPKIPRRRVVSFAGVVEVKTLSSEDGSGLREVLSQASMEHRISSYRVIMDTTRSLLNSDSSSGSTVLDSGLEDVFDELSKPDDYDLPKVPDNRRDIVQELLKTEKEYCKSLRGILDTYAEPLRKFSSLTNEDHMILFVGLEPIISFSHMLTTKIEDCLKSWDTQSTQIGSLFNNKKLWSVHEEYCSGFPKTKQFLDQKLASDDSLVQFCNLRRGQATQDLQSLLRLPSGRITLHAPLRLNFGKKRKAPQPPVIQHRRENSEPIYEEPRERRLAASKSEENLDEILWKERKRRSKSSEFFLTPDHRHDRSEFKTSGSRRMKIKAVFRMSAFHGTSPNIKRKESKKPKAKDETDNSQNKLGRTRKNGTVEPPDLDLYSGGAGILPDHLAHTDMEFEVQRIPEYDKYLHELLEDTDPDHPDFEDLSKAASRSQKMVREHEDELGTNTDNVKMDRIQQRFPNDDLQLRDSTPQNCRSLSTRRKSAPGAVLFKTLGKSKSSSNLWSAGNNSGHKRDMDMVSPIRQHSNNNRQFILEGPVEFATGLQRQDRYLFLFNDLLLVAKQKSSTTFKLKNRVRVCEMWTGDCLDEVSECTVPPDKSFVVGWPTTNVVATFKSVELKDLWLNKITETIDYERMRECNKTLTIMVMCKEINQCHPLNVDSNKTTKEVLLEAIEKFGIPEADRGECQLWVTSSKEDSPYPLIGHELPHAIRASELRDLAHTDDPTVSLDLEQKFDESSSPDKSPGFMLKIKTKFARKSSYEDGSKVKETKKSKLRLPFRKNKDDKNNNKTPGTPSPGILYGRPLHEVMEDGELPKPIMDMMRVIFLRGPFKEGILRKSSSKTRIEDFHRRIDSGEEDVIMEDTDPLLAGCLLKEYLRSLPNCLLCGNLYPEWKKLDGEEDTPEKFNRVHDLLCTIPTENLDFLRHLLCVLYHISQKKDRNKMDARNLAVCIAPSILYEQREDLKSTKKKDLALSNYSKPLFPLVQYMIENCAELLGENVLYLFGDAPEEPLPEPKLRHDSSGTDSDSCHSIMDSASGSHSIDSLEKDIYMGERDPSPHPRLNHISPSGLSKDSGHYSSQEALDIKNDFEIQMPRARDALVRQRPVIENTPPASPHSSSVDSLLTDSTGSFITNRQFSRDTETSDSYYTAEESVRDSFDSHDGVDLHPLNFLVGNIHGKNVQSRNFSPPTSPKNVRKLHPDEMHQNLSGRRSLPLPLTIPSFDTPRSQISSRIGHSAMDLSGSSSGPSMKQISKYNLGLATSPPPRVILKQMKQLSMQRQDNSNTPMRASLDSAILSQVNESENYRSELKVSKLHSNSPKSEKDSSNSVSKSNTPERSPKSRPEKPPSYDEAVKRKFMIKNGLPLEISEQDIQREKEAQLKAKLIYEESLKRFQETTRIPEDSESESDESDDQIVNDNDVYVALRNVKDPRKVYEESMKIFEQQGKRTPSPYREKRPSPPSQGRAPDSEHLSVPKCNLHRSHSDSTEHANKAEYFRKRDASPRARLHQSPDRENSPSTRLEYSSSSVSNSSSDTVTDTQQISPYQRERSESSPVIERHRFPTTSSTSAFNAHRSPHTSAQYSDSRYSNSRYSNSRVSRSVDTTVRDREIPRRESPSRSYPRDISADAVQTSRRFEYSLSKSSNFSSESSSTQSSRDNSRSSTPSRDPSYGRKTASSAVSKSQDLPWSVKSLKQIYDHSGSTSKGNMSSAGSRPPPPPYQPPPPFRRPDSSRLSSSSQSSVGSGSTGRSTPPTKVSPTQRRTGGPQTVNYDSDGVSYV